MKLIHTSDWHIGRTLYGKRRYEEHEAFLEWLGNFIQKEKIDILLVSGDIFDNTAPSNRAQEIYYRFLCRLTRSDLKAVVITAGNHDSPSFLNAPKELLKSLNVHVIGSASEYPEDEVITIKNSKGKPEIVICAVPYLRDREIRKAEAGESFEEKEQKLLNGIAHHYESVVSHAEKISAENDKIPIVATGHLFTKGGKTVDGDGVRELYVGSLAHIGTELFPETIDYLALGHLHVPQKISGKDHLRYSGSPFR